MVKTDFNLNYYSAYQESYSSNYTSKQVGAGRGNLIEIFSYERRVMSEESVSLGLSQNPALIFSPKQEVAPVESTPAYSAEEVSQNILSFVERRLEQEVANGASPEEVSNLLSDAREGVARGISEAKDDLMALGMLSEDLESGVDDSLDLALNGLNELDQKYTVDPSTGMAVDSVIKNTSLVEESSKQGLLSDEDPVESASGAEPVVSKVNYRSKSSSDFQLMTQDGDLVSISFSNKQVFRYVSYEGVAGQTLKFDLSEKGFFDIKVQGDLDEGELIAISNLLEQVADISEKFFSGDVSSAFGAAMNVGFDGEEIAEFSLDLSMSQSYKVRQYGSDFVERGSFAPIVDQSNSLLNLLDQASGIRESRDVLRDAFDRVLAFQSDRYGYSDSAMRNEVASYLQRLLA